jgi:hypothetical protein
LPAEREAGAEQIPPTFDLTPVEGERRLQ